MKKIFCLSLSVCSSICAAPWTVNHHFKPNQFHQYPGMVVVEKDTQYPFTQLLISWNSALPKSGYFRFYLEVFDQQKKRWSTYKMYEWGAGINRSFTQNDSHGTGAKYVHVRFEGAPGKRYQKFNVKVESVDGAELSALKHIAVCASDLSLFKAETVASVRLGLNKKTYNYITGVPCISQHDERYPESVGWCSPASLAQVIKYYTHTRPDLPTLARMVFDEKLVAYGSWPFNTAQAAVYLPNHVCYCTRLPSMKNLIKIIARGYPVIVSICTTKPLPGAPKAYENGHLITVVGYDVKKGTIICHDTAEKDTADMIKQYPLEPFMRAWERRQRFAYLILPREIV